MMMQQQEEKEAGRESMNGLLASYQEKIMVQNARIEQLTDEIARLKNSAEGSSQQLKRAEKINAVLEMKVEQATSLKSESMETHAEQEVALLEAEKESLIHRLETITEQHDQKIAGERRNWTKMAKEAKKQYEKKLSQQSQGHQLPEWRGEGEVKIQQLENDKAALSAQLSKLKLQHDAKVAALKLAVADAEGGQRHGGDRSRIINEQGRGNMDSSTLQQAYQRATQQADESAAMQVALETKCADLTTVWRQVASERDAAQERLDIHVNVIKNLRQGGDGDVGRMQNIESYTETSELMLFVKQTNKEREAHAAEVQRLTDKLNKLDADLVVAMSEKTALQLDLSKQFTTMLQEQEKDATHLMAFSKESKSKQGEMEQQSKIETEKARMHEIELKNERLAGQGLG